MHVLLIGGVAEPDPGSVMGKKSGSLCGIRIWDEQPVSYFRELTKHHFVFKYINSLIRDLGWKKIGPGMEKSRIRDKHPGSATLLIGLKYYLFCKFGSGSQIIFGSSAPCPKHYF
jgi:hypothetical protein